MNPKMIIPTLIAIFGAYIGLKIFSSNPGSPYLVWVLIGTFVSVVGWLMYFGTGIEPQVQNNLTPEERYEACRAIETQIQQTEHTLKTESWATAHDAPGNFVERARASNMILRSVLVKLKA